MAVATIEEAVALLYGVPRESFVEERNALVKELRGLKARELANEVKALRKPSAVAAEVNRVVRADPDGVGLILQAAALLRSAQSGVPVEGVDVGALQEQYRQAIRALSQTAERDKAEVRSALEAATIDLESNEALAAGALVVVPTPVSMFGGGPAAPAAPPADELAARRAKREQMAPAKDAEAARVAEAEKAAEAARVAEAEKVAEAARVAEAEKVAEAARVAEAEKAAEEAARAEEARAQELEQRAAAKARKQQLKQLAKDHRAALRSQLDALDAEAAAASAVDDALLAVEDIAQQIEQLELERSKLEVEQEAAVTTADSASDAQAAAAVKASEAEATVLDLAAKIEALEAEGD